MTSYDPVMMVSPQEFKTLVEYYKSNITESTLLNEAARVAAETRVLMDNTKIDPALKEPQLKELMRKRTKLARKLRESAGDVSSVSSDQNLDSLQERLLKGVASSVGDNVKEAGNTIKRAIEQQQEPQQPSSSSSSSSFTPSIKKRKMSSPITIKKKSPKFTPSPIPGPAKGKKKRKTRKTEVEKLKEDQKKWEGWDKNDDDDDSDDYHDTREMLDDDDDEESGDSDY